VRKPDFGQKVKNPQNQCIQYIAINQSINQSINNRLIEDIHS